jgi:hypothetical protein
MTTFAIAAAAAVAVISTPAAAAALPGIPGIPRAWQATHRDAVVDGTVLTTQQPLGIGQTMTVKGLVKLGATGGCYYVQVQAGAVRTDSPTTCTGRSPQPFTLSFESYISARPSARLCSGVAEIPQCGSPITLF